MNDENPADNDLNILLQFSNNTSLRESAGNNDAGSNSKRILELQHAATTTESQPQQRCITNTKHCPKIITSEKKLFANFLHFLVTTFLVRFQ